MATLDSSEVDSYILSVAKAFCSKDADRSMEEAAKLTCQNAKDINVAFMGITMALVMSDGERDSMQLAKDGAQHGEEFDGDVVGACADPSIPINRRKLIIKEYITHAETLEAMSNNMLGRLKSIRNEFFDLIQDVRRSNGKSKLTYTEQEVDQIDWVCLSAGCDLVTRSHWDLI
ncbi:hypothetical protein FVEG_09927 [Fusarium verticillioides 7600]|uniref:Uncharacterized protein n=1 Tax=Gibberella moniliformis (strain M3125 / FGSC 7600) TaxID=334819 RepID=W7MGG9_GIBM7|nr:hypothetical protein FVEG_09927 [Fusarium verticillioides 7600]EWG50798.1 hypothetical protein FVEG_09927 [Fusarium verticillioides 7600]